MGFFRSFLMARTISCWVIARSRAAQCAFDFPQVADFFAELHIAICDHIYCNMQSDARGKFWLLASGQNRRVVDMLRGRSAGEIVGRFGQTLQHRPDGRSPPSRSASL